MKTLFVQSLHIHHVLQAPNNFCGPSLVLLQFVDLSLIQGVPKLDTVFQMCSHIRYAEGNNHLPLTAGYALSYTALYAVGLRCYKGTLWLMYNLSTSTLTSFSAKLLPTQSVPTPIDAWHYSSQGAGLCFLCVKPYEVPGDLLLVKIPLSSSPATVMITLPIWCHSWPVEVLRVHSVPLSNSLMKMYLT